ncbi:MAG: deoxyguanosinetriphosphate triphosphohydrolase, partial [Cellulosilyticaceae bacterium]
IVQISDKIAYINHDIDDAIRGKVLRQEQLPKGCIEILGDRSSTRINKLITDIISTSKETYTISMSKEIKESFQEIRSFLFKNVYVGSEAKEQEEKAKHVVKELYTYYMEKPDKLPTIYAEKIVHGEDLCQIVCDYIAGMTDRYAISKYCELFFPTSWKIY